MRSFVLFQTFLLLYVVGATELLDRNLAYRSPFLDDFTLSHDTRSIEQRGIDHVKRQTQSAAGFHDHHYPQFYGSDFSNSPTVWNGGVNFTHAVASGDPFDTSVILWTRAVPVSPDGTTALPDQSVPACIAYNVFTNDNLKDKPVSSGQAFTSYDIDWTVKVEAKGLKPDTKYSFQFSDCTNPSSVSPVGNTRTFASPNTPANKVNDGKPLTIAVFSCSQFQAGYFNAYGVAAHNTSADLFIHLGDYIYESLDNGAPIGRQVLGRELATIHDYRQRLNQYRTDVSLAFAHQHAPWITVWDDHEVANNAWKAGTSDSNDTTAGCSFSPSGACFTDRKLAAVRAYHEWMPIRQVAADDLFRIWRNFQIGKLFDLSMLDTRHYNRDVTDVTYNNKLIASLADLPDRSLMGPNQESWFYDTLSQSKARGAVWRIVGQQIVFTQLNESGSFDLDAWDGYRSNRQRVLDHIQKNHIDNTVILAGDSHANWVSDLAHPNDTKTYDPITGRGAIGVEFAGTAVTSDSDFGKVRPVADDLSQLFVKTESNIDLQWSEGFFRGFFTLTIDPKVLKATYYAMMNITNPNLDHMKTAEFTVEVGANKLKRPVGGGAANVKAGALKVNETEGK